jgi:type III secretion protein C
LSKNTMTKKHRGFKYYPWVMALRSALLAFCMVFGCGSAVMAEPIPWRSTQIDIGANNEPLNGFLTRLLTTQGISSSMTPAVATARVNGRFKGDIGKTFNNLIETYGLAWFYDGTTLEICSLGEFDSRLLSVDPSDLARLERNLRQFRLFDTRYPLRISAADGQVIVSGPPNYVAMVASVADRIAETPSKPKTGIEVRVFRLKYARAADTTVVMGGVETYISGIARVLNEMVSETRFEPSTNGTRVLPRTVPGLRGKGMLSVGRGEMPTAPGFGNAAAIANAAGGNNADITPLGLQTPGSSGGASAPENAAMRAARDAPSSRLATVRAEPRLNAVVVRDSPDRMPMYERLIKDLDVDLPLIEIEAAVIDVSDDKSQELGVDWRAHGRRFDISSSPNGFAGNGSRPNNDANSLLNTGDPLSAGAGLVGTLIFGSARQYFLSRLNALSNVGDARTVARPRVLTIDNTEAVLQSTSEFFVRVAGERQVDLFNVTLGLTLRVTPTLVEDGQGKRVKMIVRIEDGNANSGQEVDRIPVVSRNAIATQAVVGEGQSLLIGGYVIEENSGVRTGVPGLSNVPVLGYLFSQNSTKFRRVERMFMITPRIVTINDLAASIPSQPQPITLPVAPLPSVPALPNAVTPPVSAPAGPTSPTTEPAPARADPTPSQPASAPARFVRPARSNNQRRS